MRKLLSHFYARKFLAFAITSSLILIAGLTMEPSKLSAITLALLGSLATFSGAHAATDLGAIKKTEVK